MLKGLMTLVAYSVRQLTSAGAQFILRQFPLNLLKMLIAAADEKTEGFSPDFRAPF
jgi:hypothetical protein